MLPSAAAVETPLGACAALLLLTLLERGSSVFEGFLFALLQFAPLSGSRGAPALPVLGEYATRTAIVTDNGHHQRVCPMPGQWPS